VLMIAGTGSIVTGKTQRKEIVRVGGWGRVLGDEGSGYFLGREALRAVLLQFERRGEKTRLTEGLLRKFQWRTADDLVNAVYQQGVEIASIAPLVIETAAENDVVAQRILQKGAQLLADQARVVVMQMGILRKVGLVLMGGLVEHKQVYTNTIHLKLLKLLPQVDVRPALRSPAQGAILMALERTTKS
jgi:N-acetylglucosamine kinase-like BadF-type ATPase